MLTERRAELWDVRTGKQRAAVPLADVPQPMAGLTIPLTIPSIGSFLSCAAPLFSRDGKTLVVGVTTGDGDAVLLIDPEKGQLRQRIKRFPNPFLAIQGDGKSLAGAASSGGRLELALCNLDTFRVRTVLDKPVPGKRTIEGLAFSPDGGKLATLERGVGGSPQDACYVRVWDARTGGQLAKMEGKVAAGAGHGRGKTPAGVRSPAATTRSPAGNRPDKQPAGGAGSMFGVGGGWQGNMAGAGGPMEIEPSSEFSPLRMLFSPDAGRLAIMRMGFGGESTIDLWNLVGTVSPGDTPSAEPGRKPSRSTREPDRKENTRTWTSADGRFTVEAELVADSGDKITLKKKSALRSRFRWQSSAGRTGNMSRDCESPAMRRPKVPQPLTRRRNTRPVERRSNGHSAKA